MPTNISRKSKQTTGPALARVVVLTGGLSAERDISLKSGDAVCKALEKAGYPVERIDMTSKSLRALSNGSFDMAFLALHGTFGEDGELQRALDDLGVHYCGSGAQASHNAMDKLESKILFLKNGVPTAPYHEITRDSSPSDISRFQRRLGLPLVVKPAAQGSSLGVSKVNAGPELAPAIETALKFGHRAMVERFVPGREMVVGILDDKPLPVVEIHSPDDIFSTSAKYRSPKTKYDIEPSLEPEQRSEIQHLGLAAHRALGCRHFSRVDMILGNDGRVYVLEVNTLPGLTERSLLPKAARAAGLSFPNLCKKIVEMTMNNGSPG